jgi:uncharacterized cupin superfamily protein
MSDASRPIALTARDVPAQLGTSYPPEFAERVVGRRKQRLGDVFGLDTFGVNLVTLPPGSQSSIRHRHTVQDEFVYVLAGELVLVHDGGETLLAAGACAGFQHGGTAHHLINRSGADASFLEVGDRLPGDTAEYPEDDLVAVRRGTGWRYTRRNGEPYP